MKRLITTATAVALLATPAVATAVPTKTDRVNAAQECRAERGTTAATREAFATRYGTNAKRRNAFGKCVSARARGEERERAASDANASKRCKTERASLGEAAFAAKYGTGKKGRNAHGKCVSQAAKRAKADADKADRDAIAKRHSAAKTCAAERGRDRAAFKRKYGTNRTKSNAFGKCVSALAKGRHR